jgi:RNA polymerase sigma-70 factor, ECF subfamily
LGAHRGARKFLDLARPQDDTERGPFIGPLLARIVPVENSGARVLKGDNVAGVRRSGKHPARSQIELWLGEARAGSSAALGSLMEGCRKYLLFKANEALDSDLRPKAAASDLVQDSFVEVQQDFASFQGTSEEELFAWLGGILANRLANNIRRYRHTNKRSVDREMPLELAPELAMRGLSDDATPSGAMIADEEARRVQAAMARLPEPLRTVLVLRTWERKSFVEIGVELNKSPDAARKLWARAVSRLEEELHNIA